MLRSGGLKGWIGGFLLRELTRGVKSPRHQSKPMLPQGDIDVSPFGPIALGD